MLRSLAINNKFVRTMLRLLAVNNKFVRDAERDPSTLNHSKRAQVLRFAQDDKLGNPCNNGKDANSITRPET
jgi:hypothetical protein